MFVCLFLFYGHHMACGILFPEPVVEPMSPTMKAWNLNHCTANEVFKVAFVLIFFLTKNLLTKNV